jgi:aminoglycoside 6'-N-acetyltransferase
VILRGERVVLRSGETDDVASLVAILAEPEVVRRWGPFTEADVVGQFIGSPEAFVIVADRTTVGAIQFGEERDPMYRHASVDIFLSTAFHRRRLGSDAIRTLARFLFDERHHHRLTIDPAVDNIAAIRAYEAVGFQRVGVLRAYERGQDGTFHDGLLMDLLADELR